MMENISVIATFKKKKPQHGHGTIYIRGYYNRKPTASKSTGHVVNYLHWDHDLRQVMSQAPNAKLINTCIQLKIQEMKAQLMRLEIMGATLNRQHIKKIIQGNDTGRSFISFCTEKIEANYSSKETRRTYKAELTKLQKFAGDLVMFSDIDYDFLTRYRNYMRDVLKNAHNTRWKTFKFINTMLNFAEKQGGIIPENAMKQFDRGKYEETTPTYIELDDCDRILKVVSDDDQPVMIRRVATYFLFMCYSGLRFEDAMTFDPALHIIEGDRLVKRTLKKDVPINFTFWDRLSPIVELVKQHPLKLSNQNFNMYLKVVAAAAKIEKDLTSHVGRHSMGGFLTDAGASLEQVQKILGHKDKKSTKIYAHMKNKKVDEGVLLLNKL